jgi:uncharacterized LabA/DUF88 family protein
MGENRRLWLIDAGYMFNASKSVGSGFQYDYRKIRDVLEKDGEIFQAYYLNSTPNPPKDVQDHFHAWMRSAPPNGPKIQTRLYGLKTLKVECPKCKTTVARKVQKGVDIGIATLALTMINRYDTLILSSGDGDFKDTVEFIRNQSNKGFELAVFQPGVSTDLQSMSDKIYWLNEFKDQIQKTDKKAPALMPEGE